MKKWKPWVLGMATLAIASAGISAISTSIQSNNIEQNSNLETKFKKISIQTRKPGDPGALKLSDLDVNNDGFKIKESNFQQKYTQIKPSIWIDNFANTKNDGAEFRNEFLSAFISDFSNTYSGRVGVSDFYSDVTVKIESANNWRSKFKNEINDLITINNKAVDYLNELNKKENNNFNDLSTRTQNFYDKRKNIDDTNRLYLQHRHSAWSRPVLGGYKATSGTSFIQEGTAEASLKNLLNSSKALVEDYYINPNDTHGLGSLYTVIRFRFDTNKRLNINSLNKYIDVDQSTETFTFKLHEISQDLNNWLALTDKARVFDNNGLHDYFDVTYDTFWNEVKKVVKQKGLDISSLNNQSFKNTNIYKQKNVEFNTKSSQTIDEIINSKDNTISGGGVSKSGWITPTNGVGGRINTLTYKVNMNIPKYQKTNDNFTDRMNVNVTQQDDLTNAKQANNDFAQKEDTLNKVTEEQNKITNEIKELENKLQEHLALIKQKEEEWKKYLNDSLGNNINGPGSNNAALKTAYNNIIQNAENEVKIVIDTNKDTIKKIMDKFNDEKNIYRPQDWMWLVANSEITQQEADEYNKNVIDKINEINEKTVTELNNLLTLNNQNIKTEFETKRQEIYKGLKTTLNSYKNELNALTTKITEQVTKNNEIKNWSNTNKTLQDTILASVQVQVNHNNMQLYKPKDVDTTDQWITQQDRWWTIYNPNGSANNSGQQTRYLVDKNELIKNINQKIADEIKKQDSDFNININGKNIISPNLIANMTGVDDQTDFGATITLGSGEHEYKITPSVNYRLEAINNTNEHKINKLEFNITAKNQFIQQSNAKVNGLIGQITNNETQLTSAKQTVDKLLSNQEEHNITKLEELLQKLTTSNIVQEIQNKNIQYSWQNKQTPDKLTKQIYHHKKLSPLFLIVCIIVFVVLLILLILLLVWLSKSNYKHRYKI